MHPHMSSQQGWGGEGDYLLTLGKFTAPCYLLSLYFSASEYPVPPDFQIFLAQDVFGSLQKVSC